MYKAIIFRLFKPVIREVILQLILPRLREEAKNTDNKIDDEVVIVVEKIVKEILA